MIQRILSICISYKVTGLKCYTDIDKLIDVKYDVVCTMFVVLYYPTGVMLTEIERLIVD